eukprot:Plantae.Rhodophyta-Hildenbrandia_rubra.ctg3905.p1 GENE.Plantae.Rhodophyta-Hildenbrandia_rubra.ctg3905~~Plantae.Rhodophyta-Hildenbrandia_rubra.ctg3905.p1  ORF type:complete len:312 (-),score=83.58 Plantae.Rhodophyta-Hildenbrandia_rubra.ctg3905:2213-3148(-)
MTTIDVKVSFKGKLYPLTLAKASTVSILRTEIAKAVGEENESRLRLLIPGNQNVKDDDSLEKVLKGRNQLKVMVLISKSGREEERKKKDEEERRRKLKAVEDVKDGKVEREQKEASGSVVEKEVGGDEVGDDDKFVLINQGRRKWRVRVVGEWTEVTVKDIKDRLVEMTTVAYKEQRLLTKGKELADEETLAEAGCKGSKCGGRWMLLCREGWHVESARQQDFSKAQREVEAMEKELSALEMRIKHRMAVGTDVGIEVQRLEDTANRLKDNVGAFSGKDVEVAENLTQRIESVTESLKDIRKEMLETAWSK